MNRQKEALLVGQKGKYKYFRKAAIFQQDYLDELNQQGTVVHQDEAINEQNQKYKILFIFFRIFNQIYLLLGRERSNQNQESESQKSSKNSELSYASSALENIKNKDHDSNFFVRIMMDTLFLRQLKNPIFQYLNIEKVFQEEKISNLINDETFQIIVQNELKMKYGEEKLKIQKQESDSTSIQLQENLKDFQQNDVVQEQSGEESDQLEKKEEEIDQQELNQDFENVANESENLKALNQIILEQSDETDTQEGNIKLNAIQIMSNTSLILSTSKAALINKVSANQSNTNLSENTPKIIFNSDNKASQHSPIITMNILTHKIVNQFVDPVKQKLEIDMNQFNSRMDSLVNNFSVVLNFHS